MSQTYPLFKREFLGYFRSPVAYVFLVVFLLASVGLNVGLDFLPASLPFAVHAGRPLSPEEAADVVWLDLVTTNVDRTPRNPNLLWWHGQLWLIDHGAALYRHHVATVGADEADRPFPQIVDHVLLTLLGGDPAERLATLRAAHAALAPRVDAERLAQIAAEVPADWAGEHDYAGYLAERIGVVGRWLDAIEGLDTTASATSWACPRKLGTVVASHSWPWRGQPSV